jgi:hypothetical protein
VKGLQKPLRGLPNGPFEDIIDQEKTSRVYRTLCCFLEAKPERKLKI